MRTVCEDTIAYPERIEYKVVKVLFLNKASELGASLSLYSTSTDLSFLGNHSRVRTVVQKEQENVCL